MTIKKWQKRSNVSTHSIGTVAKVGVELVEIVITITKIKILIFTSKMTRFLNHPWSTSVFSVIQFKMLLFLSKVSAKKRDPRQAILREILNAAQTNPRLSKVSREGQANLSRI